MSEGGDSGSRTRGISTSSTGGKPSPSEGSAAQGVQLLPLITRHYKTALLLLLVWVLGYLGFSTSWVLIGFFFYVLNQEYRKAKNAKRIFAQDAAVNEKAAILARVDELPAWVYFPDIERAEWLNKMIHQMWPYIGDYVKKLLKETVEPIVDTALPGSLKPFKFEHIDLGDTPPRIGGVKVYSENVRRDEVILDLEIFYAGDAEVKVAVRGMNAGIKNLTIHGIVRVVFKPLVPIVPLIGGMNIFFLNQPSIDFDLTNFANILDTPVLSNTLRTVLEDLIAYYLVLPNKIPIQLVNDIDVNLFRFPMPQGVLRLHVVAARELLKADTGMFGKSSDPYAKIYVGAQTFQTQTVKNNINPVWNRYFEAVVDQKHGQVAEIEVLDEDPGKDDELGTASINIENVANAGSVDSWLPLENVKTGMVHIRALWFHLSKDPEDLEREKCLRKKRILSDPRIYTGKTLTDGLRPSSEEHLASALLMVMVDSAKSLPVVTQRERGKKVMTEPSPYVNMGVGNIKKKSMMKPKSTDPRWEENFQFMVVNPKVQELFLEILDGGKKKKTSKDGTVADSSKGDKKLGYISYPIKNLLTAKDMTVHRPFQLQDSDPNGRITLRLCLRILTSEVPEDWAMDPAPVETASTPVEEKPSPDTTTPDPPQADPVEPMVTKETVDLVEADPNDNEKVFLIGGDSDSSSKTLPDRPGQEIRQRGQALSRSSCPFGKIQLTVRYSSSRQKLILVVHQCVNLIPCDDDNLADPYIRIYLHPDHSSSSKRKTQTSKNNLNPIYDETFEWSVNLQEASSRMFDIAVKNSVGFLSRGQKHMGQLFVDLARQDDITKAVTEWYDLMDPDTDHDSITSDK